MRADIRTIDVEHVPINSAILVQVEMQTFEDSIEQPFSRPTAITTVNRLPLAVAFRHITPLRTAVQHPKHSVQNYAMIDPLTPSGSLLRQQRLAPVVRLISQLVTTARASRSAHSSALVRRTSRSSSRH